MRGTKWTFKAMAVASLGLFACSSSSDISDGTLSFTIAEGLLVVEAPDPGSGVASPQFGSVVLSSAAGSCPLLQAGYPYQLISDTAFLFFPIANLLADNDAGPLVAGTYNIIDLSSTNPINGPGLFANGFTIETDVVCDYTDAVGTGGTVSVVPMDTSSGGSSTVSYSVIFSNTRITGSYALSTCVISSDAGGATGPGDGGCLLP
jgi:hypothetical protein